MQSMLATRPTPQGDEQVPPERRHAAARGDAAARDVAKARLLLPPESPQRSLPAPWRVVGPPPPSPERPPAGVGPYGHQARSPKKAAPAAGMPPPVPSAMPRGPGSSGVLLSTPSPAARQILGERGADLPASAWAGAPKSQQYCCSSGAAAQAGGLRPRTIFGTRPIQGGQTLLQASGHSCSALEPPHSVAGGNQPLATGYDSAQGASQQPWAAKEHEHVVAATMGQPQAQSPQTIQAEACGKPLKVFLPTYECEVPTLDPQMPAKKRFPEW